MAEANSIAFCDFDKRETMTSAEVADVFNKVANSYDEVRERVTASPKQHTSFNLLTFNVMNTKHRKNNSRFLEEMVD